MARLNEPVAESVEGLKRRFVRQNRELAKNNSNQSMKIRTLEGEVSLLKTENASLNQKVLRQEAEINIYKHSNIRDGIEECRLQMEEKVNEMQELLGLLGLWNLAEGKPGLNKRPSRSFQGRPMVGTYDELSRPACEPNRQNRRLTPTCGELIERARKQQQSPPKSPTKHSSTKSPTKETAKKVSPEKPLQPPIFQQARRTTPTLGELLSQQEGRLPTIAEGKRYPRKSLESSNETSIQHGTGDSDSPDIGPPPKALFDQTEVTDEAAPVSQSESQAEEQFSAFLSSNLETRKRRRETSRIFLDDTAGIGGGGSDPEEVTLPTRSLSVSGNPIRAGAKRKLSHSDNVDDANIGSGTAKDAEVPAEMEVKDGKPSKKLGTDRKTTDAIKSSDRKALGSKTVNTDPLVSPKRTSRDSRVTAKRATRRSIHGSRAELGPHISPPTSPTKSSAESRAASPTKNTTRSPPVSPKNPKADDPPASPTKAHASSPYHQMCLVSGGAQSSATYKSEPKTPPGLDLFSPASTQPSEVKQEGREATPPPIDLNKSNTITSAANASAAGRGSRRARASVSYAEPKLNVKMRRPGRELADAVKQSDRKSEEPEETKMLGRRRSMDV